MDTKNYDTLLEENKELKHLINQFKNLLDSIPDPVFMKDENLRWIYGNPVILNLYSIDKDNYVGKTEDQLLPAEFAESCMESDRQAVAKRTISKSEEQARDEHDELHYYEVFKVPSYDKVSGKFSGLIGIGRDVTKRKQIQEALESENIQCKKHEKNLSKLTETLEEKVQQRTVELQNEKQRVEQLAYIDALTGLNNRRSFYKNSLLIDENARNNKVSYALILLDIDFFKKINDTHGHAMGDKVLKMIANVIIDTKRTADIEGRIGGEEFAITLIDTSINDAITLAKRLCTEVANITLHSKLGEITLTASFGVTAYHKDSSSFESILAVADKALYQAKQSGRNKVITKLYS